MPISSPPLDEAGRVVPHDHAEIAGRDRLIRRISEEFVVDGAKPGTRRLSSMAYQPSSGPGGGMSVDIERLILEAGLSPAAYVTTPVFTGSVVFSADVFRVEGLQVGYDPLPSNSFHGEVWGTFTTGVKKRLRRKATWFVELPGVDLTA